MIKKIKEFWRKIEGYVSIAFIVAFMSTCTYALNKSDELNKKTRDSTTYYKITNKDYRNISTSMLSDDYEWVVIVSRYDSEMNRIRCSRDMSKIYVTRYGYDLLRVGVTYSRKELKKAKKYYWL